MTKYQQIVSMSHTFQRPIPEDFGAFDVGRTNICASILHETFTTGTASRPSRSHLKSYSGEAPAYVGLKKIGRSLPLICFSPFQQ